MHFLFHCAESAGLKCTACPSGKYAKGCKTGSAGVCTACNTCATGTIVAANCSGAFDVVCRGTPCNASASCGGLFCNYPTDNITGCQVTWVDTSTPTSFLCVKPSTQGICVPCPPGWSAAGAYCQPCSTGMSCDALGRATCSGECSTGAYPTCDTTTGASTCAACTLDVAGMAAAHQVATRGGVLDRADLCGTYFQCSVGYYLQANSVTFALQCVMCQLPEANISQFEFTSGGLTYGDQYSCAYHPAVQRQYTNVPGFFGSPAASCPAGTTSERGRAASAADCVICPNPPANGQFDPGSFLCGIQCNQGYSRSGEACISVTRVQCPVAGYALSAAGQCASVDLPWSAAGWIGMGSLSVSVMPWAISGVVYFDAASGVATTSTQFFTGVDPATGSGGVAYCPSYVATTTFVQDLPLSELTCDKLEYHRFYMVVAAPQVVVLGAAYGSYFAFIERDMGFNNRNLLWWVSNAAYAGHIMHRWRLPGRVCSASSASLAGSSYLYLSFCNASFVSFLNLSATLPGTSFTNGVYKNIRDCGRRADLLIGSDSVGNADGARDEARFGDSLSLSAFQSNRLFILDRTNCRLAEAVVDYPGSAFTRASTLRSNCHDRTLGLAYPRMLTPVLGGTLFLFVTDRGLMQVDAALRTIQAINAPLLPDNVIWVGADPSGGVVYAGNGTHMASISTIQQPCPAGTTSLPGLSCGQCGPGQYISAAGVCTQCSTGIVCPAGSLLSGCSASADWSCHSCGVVLASPFRYIEDCTTVYVSPCPVGYYGTADCVKCPEWATTEGVGAKNVSACMCGYNGTMISGMCMVPAPSLDQSLPSWVLPYACSIDECGFKGCYLKGVSPRVCAPCSEHPSTVGIDGLRCTVCPGFREPNPTLDACVCQSPAHLGDDGVSCVCPVGNGIVAGVCAACALSTFSAVSVVMQEAAGLAQQSAECAACPPGWTTAGTGGTACVQCQKGLYREDGMPACVACAVDWYASNPANGASCTQCSPLCASGMRWNACPGSSKHFVCIPCAPELSANEVWVAGVDNTDCKRQCLPGFFRPSGATACTRCSADTLCPVGFAGTPCSVYADFTCNIPCSDETMPADNAEWASGCTWRCKDGFVMRTKTVLSWTEFACEEIGSTPWAGWS